MQFLDNADCKTLSPQMSLSVMILMKTVMVETSYTLHCSTVALVCHVFRSRIVYPQYTLCQGELLSLLLNAQEQAVKKCVSVLDS